MGSLDSLDLADSTLASDLDEPLASSSELDMPRNGRGVKRWGGHMTCEFVSRLQESYSLEA